MIEVVAPCITVAVVIGTWAWYGVKTNADDKMAQVKLKEAESLIPERPLPPEPTIEQRIFLAKKQALESILARRLSLENELTSHRNRIANTPQEPYKSYREDTLKAVTNAREELALLVKEEQQLLKTMQGDNDEPVVDAAAEPVRIATGGPVAQRVDDLSVVHDAEPDQPEASREGAA